MDLKIVNIVLNLFIVLWVAGGIYYFAMLRFALGGIQFMMAFNVSVLIASIGAFNSLEYWRASALVILLVLSIKITHDILAFEVKKALAKDSAQ